MSFEIATNMHMYLEIDNNITEDEAEEKMYDILYKLQEEVKGLSFTIHEIEIEEI